jgi:NitT/TauT family transport system substrate-binding protein
MARLLPLLAVVVAVVLGACAAPASTPPASKPAAPAATAAPPAASGAASVPATATAAASAPARESIKYGYVAILPGAPNFIAQERGYFAEQGIDVEWVPFDSGALMVAPTAAGQIDVMIGVPGPSFFNALGRDITFRIFADQSRGPTGLLMRRELADQVHGVADLRGRRVSFNVEGSPIDYQVRLAFQRAGLSMDDVEVSRVVNTDLAPALANGSIDAGAAPEPLPVLVEARGAGVRVPNYMEAVGRVPAASFMVAGPSLQSRPDAVGTRFTVAYMRGARDYLASLRDGKVVEPAVLDILSKWTSLPADLIAQAPSGIVDRDGRVDLDDINSQQEFWLRDGQVTTRVDLSRVVDYKYLNAALPQLR